MTALARWMLRWGFQCGVMVCVTACAPVPGSIGGPAAQYLDQAVARIAKVAEEAGIPVDSGTAVAVHSEAGVAIFVAAPHEDGRLVGWLDLPSANPCAAHIAPGCYVTEPHLTRTEVFRLLPLGAYA